MEPDLFEKFPKIRPPLSKQMEAIYAEHYKENRTGATTASSLAQKMESWLHKQVALDVKSGDVRSSPTLELGAGTLNQLRYEPVNDNYDIVEPFKELFVDSPLLSRVRTVYSDISEVPVESLYRRITSVATLEHVCNLPEVIARSATLLSSDGVFRASVPSEGTWLWKLGWKLTTGLEFRIRYGLDYGQLMRHEHVNSAQEIEQVLMHFFGNVR
jgi:hypothetical protein